MPYAYYRFITILLTTFMLPFGTFVGFEFGAGHTSTALLALLAQTCVTFVQAWIWWLTLEKAKGKAA